MADDVLEQGGVRSGIDEHGIARIEFFHPLSNSLPGKVLQQLADAIRDAGSDHNVKVIVVGSSGDRAFCAGASFDELMSIQNEAEGKQFFSGFAKVINAMREAPKFVLCRVQGKAVGGGVGLACAADHTFATKHAAIKLSELAIGIGPFVIGPSVERKVGISAFSQLSMDATSWYSAEWARDKGMFAHVYETAEEMDVALEALALRLSKSNPEAMALLKEVFWEGTDHWDGLLNERAEMSGKLVLSDFTRNAIASFKKKS